MLSHPYVKHLIALVEYWNSAGWGEFLLWEVIEGQRDRPFPLLDPLPESDKEVLRRLRDELKVWPFYDALEKQWHTASLTVWRVHAQRTTADEVLRRLEGLGV